MPTLSITTNAEQAQRVSEAFGAVLNLGRNATAEEVRREVIQYLRSVVLSYENQKAIELLSDTSFDQT